jgi:hypothetical protein
MLASLVIVFREAIEAGLIVGIVLAATRSVPQRGRWVVCGIAAGVLGACLVAAFAGQLGALFNGSGQELFNAAILLIAVGMLTWHNAWMASHGRELAREVRSIGAAVAEGDRPLTALAVVVGVAVLRDRCGTRRCPGWGHVRADLSRAAGGAGASAVRRDDGADHAPGRRACCAGGVLPAAGRLLPGPHGAAVGLLLAAA